MPPKAKLPAPIDRPLSRAYLREFTGWSTAHSPGLSDPTSLRSMENCYVTRNGALAVRPGMRKLLFYAHGTRMLGTFETFFLNDGRKALLTSAKRIVDGRVMFHFFVENASTGELSAITHAEAGFTGTIPELSLSTTYIRYMQIDNKIFALPDSTDPNDTVVVFYVGATKRAVKPRAITQPGENPSDLMFNRPTAHPIVFQPDAA